MHRIRKVVGSARKSVLRVKYRVGAAVLAVSATLATGAVFVPAANATAYKVEYSKLTEAAETNFGEAVTAVLVIVGIIIGVFLGFKVVKRLLK
jgi:hypothetical protein